MSMSMHMDVHVCKCVSAYTHTCCSQVALLGAPSGAVIWVPSPSSSPSSSLSESKVLRGTFREPDAEAAGRLRLGAALPGAQLAVGCCCRCNNGDGCGGWSAFGFAFSPSTIAYGHNGHQNDSSGSTRQEAMTAPERES